MDSFNLGKEFYQMVLVVLSYLNDTVGSSG